MILKEKKKNPVFHVIVLSEIYLSLWFTLVVLFEFSVINNVEKYQYSSESEEYLKISIASSESLDRRIRVRGEIELDGETSLQ